MSEGSLVDQCGPTDAQLGFSLGNSEVNIVPGSFCQALPITVKPHFKPSVRLSCIAGRAHPTHGRQ